MAQLSLISWEPRCLLGKPKLGAGSHFRHFLQGHNPKWPELAFKGARTWHDCSKAVFSQHRLSSRCNTCTWGAGGPKPVWAVPSQVAALAPGIHQIGQQAGLTALLWAVGSMGATKMPLSSLPLRGEQPVTVPAGAKSCKTPGPPSLGSELCSVRPPHPHRTAAPEDCLHICCCLGVWTDRLYLHPSALCW